MKPTKPWPQIAGCLVLAGACASTACKREDTTTPDETQLVEATPEGDEIVWPDEPFRSERPEPKPIQDLTLPPVETFTLENGVEVYLVQPKTLPTALLSFEWDLGAVDDPKAKAGLSSVCSATMSEATAKRDKASFSGAQDDHGGRVWIRAGDESTSVTVMALTRELAPMLERAAEMMLQPGCRKDDFERVRAVRKDRLVSVKSSASSIASRVYPALVWGEDHPYARMETDASLDAITVRDCKRWARRLDPKGARLWVVGKLSKDELIAQLEPHFGKWKGKAPKRKEISPAKPKSGTIFFVHVPRADQSQVVMGHPGPTRDAKDYEATDVMARILGGSFSSRINMNLREDKGWTYGARGRFSYQRAGSVFTAGGSIRADATAGAVREIAKEIEHMRTTEPSARELAREQEGALLSMPAGFATATRTLGSFRSLDFYGLPLDWHLGHQDRLRALDPAAVRAAAQEHLQDSGHVILIVGDGAVVLDELEVLAHDKVLGASEKIVFLDADGNQVSRPTFDDDTASEAPGAKSNK